MVDVPIINCMSLLIGTYTNFIANKYKYILRISKCNSNVSSNFWLVSIPMIVNKINE